MTKTKTFVSVIRTLEFGAYLGFGIWCLEFMNKRIAFHTLGCKANRYDTECITAACRRAGFEIVGFDDEADVCIVNTCTVTAIADQQARQIARRAKRRSPHATIIVVGCSVQNNRKAFEAIDEIDAVFGVRCVEEIVEYLQTVIPTPSTALRTGSAEESLAVSLSGSRFTVHGSRVVPTNQSRARALLKIQDGCDRRCTYCAVWKVRGVSTSVDVQDVIDGYRALAHYPEVMLTGIHIGQYGDDLDENVAIYDLIEMLVNEPEGARIRISSLNPDEFNDRLITVLKHERVCRHVHLSVQSLADPVITAMGRSYTAGDVKRIVNTLHDAVPGIAIGADIIAGFPGETEKDHSATLDMLIQLPFSYVHVFPYSMRQGTKAAARTDQIPAGVRKERAREIIALAAEKKRHYCGQQRGQVVEAVIVSQKPDACGRVRAVADNYVTLHAPAGPAYGTIARARIEEVENEEVRASWC